MRLNLRPYWLRMAAWGRVGAVIGVGALVTCKDGGGESSVPTPSTYVGELTGQVVSAEDGGALGGVRVEVPDAGVAHTNADGRFTIHNVPPGERVPVVCSGSGRVSYARSVRVAAGAMTTFRGWMPNVDAIYPITAEAPFAIDIALTGGMKGFRFDPSPSAFAFDGGLVTGTVNVELKVFDPTGEASRNSYPGSFEMEDDGGRVMTRSTCAVWVRVTQGVNELSVAPGASIVIDAPIPQALAGTAADASAFLTYDTQGGVWRNVGVASRVEKPGASVYRFVVNSLQWFNLGEPLAQPMCVTGCVVDQRDVGIADIPVQIVSADSSRFSTVVVTGDGGCYQTKILKGTTVTVNVLDDFALSKFPVNFTVPYDAGGADCATIPAVREMPPDLVVMLGWDAGTDLDLHVTGPTRSGATFHLCEANASFTDSVGVGGSGGMTAVLKTNPFEVPPEFAVFYNVESGTYRVFVHKNDFDQAKAQLQLSGATVTAWSRRGVMRTWGLAIPAFAQPGLNLWNVFDLSFGSATAIPTFSTLDELKGIDASTDPASPVYCEP